jgi:hypothetical protein
MLQTVLIGALVAFAATYILAGGDALGAKRSERARRLWQTFLFVWPVLLVASGFWIAYVQNPAWDFPSPAFYPIAAEVIVLLLLGLIIERGVIADLRPLHRFEYAVILMVGEGAALLKTSESAPSDGDDFTAVLLSSLTVAALLSAAVLVIAAVSRVGGPRPHES